MTTRTRTTDCSSSRHINSAISRRWLLATGGATLTGAALAPLMKGLIGPKQSVFVARNQSYDGNLKLTILDGLAAVGISGKQLRGKHVLLKPNLVEPTRAIPHMTTHPAVIVAAAEVFRSFGATVSVGEGPGHVRDTEMALDESGVAEVLAGEKLRFADLNYEDVAWQPNKSRCSKLPGLFLPATVASADLVVSVPKMKTHHWIGMTGCMKNLYGVLPGIKYGWPKNVLHHHGISNTVVDVNACLPNKIAIVDGIDCMEGDGPILGTCKYMGLILVGNCLPAVDATMARIMGLEPKRIDYLKITFMAGEVETPRLNSSHRCHRFDDQ